MENQPKILEKCLDDDDNLSKYNAVENELDAIYDHIPPGMRRRSDVSIRSHIGWDVPDHTETSP